MAASVACPREHAANHPSEPDELHQIHIVFP